MMATKSKRKKIDWEEIEKEYRIGQKSLRAIASVFNVSPGSISKRAKKYDWVQDKSKEIRERTQAALAKETLKGNTKGNTPTREDVDRAVQTNIEVIRGHRKIIQRTFDFANRLLKKIEESEEIDAKVDNRVFLSITQGLAKVIPLERQAFNLNDTSDDGEVTIIVKHRDTMLQVSDGD